MRASAGRLSRGAMVTPPSAGARRPPITSGRGTACTAVLPVARLASRTRTWSARRASARAAEKASMSAARSGSAARARATSRSRTCRGGSSAGGSASSASASSPATGAAVRGAAHASAVASSTSSGSRLRDRSWWRSRSSTTVARARTPLGYPAAGASEDRRVAARGGAVVDREGPPEQRLGEHCDEGVAALHGTASRCRRVREVDGDRARDVLGGEALANLGPQRCGRDLESPPAWFEPGTEPGESAAGEALHVVAAADRREALAPLGQHFVGLDAPLGEHGPALLRLRPDVLPMTLEQIELAALVDGGAAPPPQEHGLEQRLRERVSLRRAPVRARRALPGCGPPCAG